MQTRYLLRMYLSICQESSAAKCQLILPSSPQSILRMNSLSLVSQIELFALGDTFRKT